LADLEAPSLRIWDWLLVPIFLIAFLAGALFSLRGFFWLGAIRLTFTFHANSLVNSICHNRPDLNSEQNASCNVWWVMLPLLMLGENWHRNHHRFPSSARIGWSWLQPDLGYLVIIGLEKVGLASEVRH
jgi:stearoyl-CoA desaturase (delta-9 desaturase)